jgi:enoyl-CoA hydratase/carnithine racemase
MTSTMQPSSGSSALYAICDRVGTITLNRPMRLNAFDGGMIQSLVGILEGIARQPGQCSCLCLTGAGRGFCAGADLDFLVQLRRDMQLREFCSLLEAGRRIVTLLQELPMPVIAVVNGPAAGGGGSLAMACDFRIASETAQFTQAFAKIGVHADFGASFFLPRLVGEAKARELMFTGETIDAQEAFRIGLVNRVVPLGQLASATQALAETFLSRAPLSLKLMKQTFSESAREEFQKALDREMEAQLQCFQSEDFLAGIEAFVQKKVVSFKGK